jgi:hypothetical protein
LDDRIARSPAAKYAGTEPPGFVIPWIVGVDYEYSGGNLGFEGGTRYYICIFGIAVPVQNKIRSES